jgi:hypothetical protein
MEADAGGRDRAARASCASARGRIYLKRGSTTPFVSETWTLRGYRR